MKGKILFALMIVGILVFAGIAVGVAYSKYGDVTTKVVMDDGLTCTINGKEVKDGDTITVNLQSTKLKVCVDTEKATRIACTGWWQSSNDRITFQDGTDEEQTCAEFTIKFSMATHFDGSIYIDRCDKEMDHDAIDLYLECDYDLITVKIGDKELSEKDSNIYYRDDIDITVTFKDGKVHDLHWYGSYKNYLDVVEHKFNETGRWSSGTIHLDNDNYFATAYGHMHIDID